MAHRHPRVIALDRPNLALAAPGRELFLIGAYVLAYTLSRFDVVVEGSMASVNWKRVFLGAVGFCVVYGAICAAAWFLVLRELWRETVLQRGFASPENLTFGAWFAFLVYSSAVLATWLYAVIRTHYGPGPRTAFLLGVTLWLWGGMLPFLAITPLLRLPWTPMMVSGGLGFFAIVGAVLAAGWLYREAEPVTTPLRKSAAA